MEPSFDSQFLFVVLSSLALPLLAFTALILRKGLFSGKRKIFMMVLGLGLLLYSVFETFKEHNEITIVEILVAIFTATITIYILSHFNHAHTHEKELGGAKGIIISESFHSLIDGAVIGATYLVTPIFGVAATLGILWHELPKIIGTLAILRSFGLSVQKTIIYGIASQIGSPVAAILIYILGKKINDEHFHLLEIASVSSLAAIVIWIIYLEWNYHRHHHDTSH